MYIIVRVSTHHTDDMKKPAKLQLLKKACSIKLVIGNVLSSVKNHNQRHNFLLNLQHVMKFEAEHYAT